MDEYLILDLCYEVYSFLTVYEYTDIMSKELLDYDKFYKVSTENIPTIQVLSKTKNDYVELVKYKMNKEEKFNDASTLDAAVFKNNWKIAEYLLSIGLSCRSTSTIEILFLHNKLDLVKKDHENDHSYGKIRKDCCIYTSIPYRQRPLIYYCYSLIENRITNNAEILDFIKSELHTPEYKYV